MGRTKTLNRKYKVKRRGQTMKRRGVRKPTRQSRYGKQSTARSQSRTNRARRQSRTNRAKSQRRTNRARSQRRTSRARSQRRTSRARSQSRTSRARKQGRYSRKTVVRRRTNTRRTKKMIGGGEPVSFALRFKREGKNWKYQQLYAVWQSRTFKVKHKTYFTIQNVEKVSQKEREGGPRKGYLEFTLSCKKKLSGLKLGNNEFLYEISPQEGNQATTSIEPKLDEVKTTGKLDEDVETGGLYYKLFENNNNLPPPTKIPSGFTGDIQVFNETYEKIKDKTKSEDGNKYILDGSYLNEVLRHVEFRNTFKKIIDGSTDQEEECLRNVEAMVTSFNKSAEPAAEPSLARRGVIPKYEESTIDSDDRFPTLLRNLEEFAKKSDNTMNNSGQPLSRVEEISRMLDILREQGTDTKPKPELKTGPINPLIDDGSEFRYGDIKPSQNSGIVKSEKIIRQQKEKTPLAESNFSEKLQELEQELFRLDPDIEGYKQLEKNLKKKRNFIIEAKQKPNRFFNADMVKLRFAGDESTVPDFIAVSCPIDRVFPLVGDGKEIDAKEFDAKKRQHPIWEEIIEQYGVDTIIKLTGDVENKRSKCYPYHKSLHTPGGNEMEEEEMEGVTIYSPYVNGKKVNIHHFKAWPDHGVPLKDAKDKLIKLVMAVKDKMSAKKPIIVHCSAGVGRTGTFILMVYILKMFESFEQGDENIEGPFGLNFDTNRLGKNLVKVILDVLLYLLRTFRKISVQTKDQEKYLFSYINSFLAAEAYGGVSLGANTGESREGKVTFEFYSDGTQNVIYEGGEKKDVIIQVDGEGGKILFEQSMYQRPSFGERNIIGFVEVDGVITEDDVISTISDIKESEKKMTQIINLIDGQNIEGEEEQLPPLPLSANKTTQPDAKLLRSTLPEAPGVATPGSLVLNLDTHENPSDVLTRDGGILDEILERSGIPKGEIQNFKTVTGLTQTSDIYKQDSLVEIARGDEIEKFTEIKQNKKSRHIFFGGEHNLKFSFKDAQKADFNQPFKVNNKTFRTCLTVNRNNSELIKPGPLNS